MTDHELLSQEELDFIRSVTETQRKHEYAFMLKEYGQDAAYYYIPRLLHDLDHYTKFAKHIASLPQCNDCGIQKTCAHRPGWGETVRYNCPLWVDAAAKNEGGSG